MDTEKILELFKKYAGETIDLYGLIVTPVLVEPSLKTKGQYNMFFNFENPNNVSYYTTMVENEIAEDVYSFESIINENINTFLLPSIKRGLYFNNELRQKIQNVFDSVKIIKFVTGTPFVGYNRYEIHIESLGFEPKAFDDESFYIVNNVKAHKAIKNGKEIDTEEAILEYQEDFLPEQEIYWETENLYIEIDSILNNYPLLNDRWSHIASYYDTKFIR